MLQGRHIQHFLQRTLKEKTNIRFWKKNAAFILQRGPIWILHMLFSPCLIQVIEKNVQKVKCPKVLLRSCQPQKLTSQTSCLRQIWLTHTLNECWSYAYSLENMVWSFEQYFTLRKLWPLCMQGELCSLHCSISMFFLSLKNFIFSGALYCKTF